MQPIGRITPVAPGWRAVRQASGGVPDEAAAADASPSTALVTGEARELSSVRSRPTSAAFLAHLIATRVQVPQARLRRRGEPDEAAAAYRSAAAAGVVWPVPRRTMQA